MNQKFLASLPYISMGCLATSIILETILQFKTAVRIKKLEDDVESLRYRIHSEEICTKLGIVADEMIYNWMLHIDKDITKLTTKVDNLQKENSKQEESN